MNIGPSGLDAIAYITFSTMCKRPEPTLSSEAADVSISTIDPTICEAIKSTVAASIGGLADRVKAR